MILMPHYDLDAVDADLGMSWREWFDGYEYAVKFSKSGNIYVSNRKSGAWGGVRPSGMPWGMMLRDGNGGPDFRYIQYLIERRDAHDGRG